MTEKEAREAEKSFRVSIHFLWWCFIIYGNWKRRILKMGKKPRFHVYDFHPFTAKETKGYYA